MAWLIFLSRGPLAACVPEPARKEPPWLLPASMVALVLFWGLAFVGIKQALVHMSWVTLTFLRFTVADICYVAYLLAVRPRPARPRAAELPALAVLAFLGFTGYHLLLNLGEADPAVTAGTAALIIASAPAFIALLAVPILQEPLSPARGGALALAFAGLAVLVGFAGPGSALEVRLSPGALVVLGPAVFTALYFVLGKRRLARFPPFVFVAYTILLGTLLTLPLVLATWPEFVRDLGTMGFEGFLPALLLGIFPTFAGYGIYFRALERMPAAAAGSWLYLSTLIAIVGGILVLGETLPPAILLGGTMVIAGVVLAQRLRKR